MVTYNEMAETNKILELLYDLYSAHEANVWLRSPNNLLGGKTAIELIKRGEHEKVKSIVQGMLDGVYR